MTTQPLMTPLARSLARKPGAAAPAAALAADAARRVLVVEDQVDIADLVAMHVRDLGLEVDVRHDGLAGCEAALSGRYGLVVLDIMLPQLDGLEIVRRLRMQSLPVPVLMLTARSSELDRVLGLELGADDYLTKPF